MYLDLEQIVPQDKISTQNFSFPPQNFNTCESRSRSRFATRIVPRFWQQWGLSHKMNCFHCSLVDLHGINPNCVVFWKPFTFRWIGIVQKQGHIIVLRPYCKGFWVYRDRITSHSPQNYPYWLWYPFRDHERSHMFALSDIQLVLPYCMICSFCLYMLCAMTW